MIKIIVNDLELDMKEAKELYEELDEIFGKSKDIPKPYKIHDPWDIYKKPGKNPYEKKDKNPWEIPSTATWKTNI